MSIIAYLLSLSLASFQWPVIWLYESLATAPIRFNLEFFNQNNKNSQYRAKFWRCIWYVPNFCTKRKFINYISCGKATRSTWLSTNILKDLTLVHKSIRSSMKNVRKEIVLWPCIHLVISDAIGKITVTFVILIVITNVSLMTYIHQLLNYSN